MSQDRCEYCGQEERYGHNAICVMNTVNELRDALTHIREIIKDGAMTGFNCHDGDWAERLFASQGMTYSLVRAHQQSPNQEISK